MPVVTEDYYEQHALSIFEQIGYEVLHGPDIAPDAETPLRENWDEVFLDGILTSFGGNATFD